jgi:hypothetical protein
VALPSPSNLLLRSPSEHDRDRLGLNGLPRSLRWPCSASPAEIARRLSAPPFGFLRVNLALAAPVCRLRPLTASLAAVAQGLASARRVELCQRRAQRFEARGMGEFVIVDKAPDRRRHVVGKVNRRHDLARPLPH